MPETTAETRHEGVTSDQDPLLLGEQASILQRLRQSIPAFSFRRWRRSQREETPDDQEHTDLETGPGAEPSTAHSESLPGPSQQTEGEPSRSTDGEHAATSQGSAERRNSSDSPMAKQGILGGLLRLGGVGASTLPRSSNSSLALNPTCLICLEPLAPEDFEAGEAIILECQCRGDMAMRHRTCAEKWAHVKGNRVCDICKTVVKNLPEVAPREPDSASTQAYEDGEPGRSNPQLFAAEQVPGGADVVFDCIRVTWVAMIICILFFEMNLANALWTGLIVGLAYTLFVRAMYRHQLAVMMREQQRNAGETPVQHVVHVV